MSDNHEKSIKEDCTDKPSVFHFHDYRKFLGQHFSYLGKIEKNFSMRKLSMAAGLTSCYLSHVLNQSVPLSTKALNKLLPYLHLSKQEALYLKLIRTIGESLDSAERITALRRVQKILEARGINTRDVNSYRYLSKWHYLAIREMVDIKGFRLDPNWIRKKLNFNVPIRDIRSALKFLTEFGFIKTTENGRPIIAKDPLHLEAGFHKVALQEIYKSFGELALRSYSEVPRKYRNVMSHNIAIPKNRYAEVRKFLENTFERLNQLTTEFEDPDSVYHISFNAFPLTRVDDEGENNEE